MFKVASVKLSDLGLDCWSAKRFVGDCVNCKRLQNCSLQEAKEGRIKKAVQVVGEELVSLRSAIAKLDKVLDDEFFTE